MLSRLLVPIKRSETILSNADARPEPIPEGHLCALVVAMCSEREVELRLGLVNWHNPVVSCAVEEADDSL